MSIMTAKPGLLWIVMVTGCHEETLPADIPEPIKGKVEVFRHQTPLCSDASIVEFLFQNANVYGFSEGSCVVDGATSIYDATGNPVCIVGGLTGNTTCNGEPFSKATQLRIIWKNK